VLLAGWLAAARQAEIEHPIALYYSQYLVMSHTYTHFLIYKDTLCDIIQVQNGINYQNIVRILFSLE